MMREAAQAEGLGPGWGKPNQSGYGWDGGVVIAQLGHVTQPGGVSEASW